MKSSNITVTDARLNRLLDNKIDQRLDKRNIPSMIEKTVNDAKTRTGVIKKFYHYKGKALVELSDGKEVLCSYLRRMDGNIIDFFTPEGELSFCETLKEPCILPRAELNVMVVDVNDGTKEQLILGYYPKNDIVYIHPAEQGHYKITNINATNEYGIDIGGGKVEIRSMDGVGFTEGVFPDDETAVEYANVEQTPTVDDVYTKEELYTRDEVDELIAQAIDDLRKELKPEEE